MTNLLLRRLATKGYLRIKQLNRKKAEYLLTPRGLSEKAKKSVHYTLKTLQSFALIKREMRTLLSSNAKPETREILLVGVGDLADVVALEIEDFANGRYRFSRVDSMPTSVGADTLLLSAMPKNGRAAGAASVDILDALTARVNGRRLQQREEDPS